MPPPGNLGTPVYAEMVDYVGRWILAGAPFD
jgi:hypothetical protein